MISEIAEIVAKYDSQIELLEERLADKILALDHLDGWKAINEFSEDDSGMTLESFQSVVPKLSEMTQTNPLFVRGAQLRHAYVFGRGLEIRGNLKPRTKKIMNEEFNKRTLFSVKAYETHNLGMFSAGNVIILRNTKTNQFYNIPMLQIQGAVVDEFDPTRIQYILRVWGTNSNGQPNRAWFPTSHYIKEVGGKGIRSSIEDSSGESVPVRRDFMAYIHSSRQMTGSTWGVPDSLAGMVWTVAYSAYLSNNAKLVEALSKFAWKITNATRPGMSQAAAEVSRAGQNVGATALHGDGSDVRSMGVPSAQVNMNNGQPLAAMVATSFGVPVIALLSSPGATGGSYGAATTLDVPTIKGMEALQDSWKDFYEEILGDIGSPGAEVYFPTIESDPEYRQAQALVTAYESEGIHQDELRAGLLRILPAPELHPEPPKVGSVKNLGAPSVATGQGKSGVVPGGVDQDVTNHDGDNE